MLGLTAMRQVLSQYLCAFLLPPMQASLALPSGLRPSGGILALGAFLVYSTSALN